MLIFGGFKLFQTSPIMWDLVHIFLYRSISNSQCSVTALQDWRYCLGNFKGGIFFLSLPQYACLSHLSHFLFLFLLLLILLLQDLKGQSHFPYVKWHFSSHRGSRHNLNEPQEAKFHYTLILQDSANKTSSKQIISRNTMSVSQSAIWYVRAKWSLAPYGTDNKFKWDTHISKENNLATCTRCLSPH